MQSLETPTTKDGDTRHPPPCIGDASAQMNAVKKTRANTMVDSDSEMETDEETPEGDKAKSTIIAYLERVFSKKLDAIHSMVERLPGIASQIWRSNPNS